MRKALSTPVLLLIAVVILAGALLLDQRRPGDEERFAGSDAQATELVEEADPGYTPWFKPVFAPSGGEVEAGLFALQAGIGGGVLGFVLGTMRERGRRRRDALAPAAASATDTSSTATATVPMPTVAPEKPVP